MGFLLNSSCLPDYPDLEDNCKNCSDSINTGDTGPAQEINILTTETLVLDPRGMNDTAGYIYSADTDNDGLPDYGSTYNSPFLRMDFPTADLYEIKVKVANSSAEPNPVEYIVKINSIDPSESSNQIVKNINRKNVLVELVTSNTCPYCHTLEAGENEGDDSLHKTQISETHPDGTPYNQGVMQILAHHVNGPSGDGEQNDHSNLRANQIQPETEGEPYTTIDGTYNIIGGDGTIDEANQAISDKLALDTEMSIDFTLSDECADDTNCIDTSITIHNLSKNFNSNEIQLRFFLFENMISADDVEPPLLPIYKTNDYVTRVLDEELVVKDIPKLAIGEAYAYRQTFVYPPNIDDTIDNPENLGLVIFIEDTTNCDTELTQKCEILNSFAKMVNGTPGQPTTE